MEIWPTQPQTWLGWTALGKNKLFVNSSHKFKPGEGDEFCIIRLIEKFYYVRSSKLLSSFFLLIRINIINPIYKVQMHFDNKDLLQSYLDAQFQPQLLQLIHLRQFKSKLLEKLSVKAGRENLASVWGQEQKSHPTCSKPERTDRWPGVLETSGSYEDGGKRNGREEEFSNKGRPLGHWFFFNN